MFSKYSSRREFLNYSKLSILFLLNSCSYFSDKELIALQESFYPDAFKDILPNAWRPKNINFGNVNSEENKKIIRELDLCLISDGWINSLNFEDYEMLNQAILLEKLDKRSLEFMNSFVENIRNKIFPVGVIPFAVIIKNNKDLINSAKQSWDFLLSADLTKKIIFPQSPRIMISIANKINSSNSLSKLRSQAMLFDDQNSINWLMDSNASVAIVPYSICSKYLKIDSRLSIVFPDSGVPLMWHFILKRSNINNDFFISWIKSLASEINAEKLAKQGWYLPFKNFISQKKYNPKISKIPGPSQKCWENSWSFPSLTKKQKIYLEQSWNQSLTP